MAGTNTINFTEASWETEVLKSEQPVLVDFWAVWCGPCRQMTPIVDQLADEYAGKAKIGKLNVDENTQIAARYRVQGIPTMLLFKGGQLVGSKVGATGKAELMKLHVSQEEAMQAAFGTGFDKLVPVPDAYWGQKVGCAYAECFVPMPSRGALKPFSVLP